MSIKNKNNTFKTKALSALMLFSIIFFGSGLHAVQAVGANVSLVTPNGGQTFSIGGTMQVTWNASNLPANAVAIINLTNGPTNGPIKTLIPIPASKTASFAIPTEILQGNTMIPLQTGSYKVEIAIYDKVPCSTGQANCIRANLLADDKSSNPITITPRVIVPNAPPTISSITPTSGRIGTNVTVIGSGFTTTGTVVELDGKIGAVITNATESRLNFSIPARIRENCAANATGCDSSLKNVVNGSYLVSIKNANGESDPRTFIVTNATSTNSGGTGIDRNEGEGTNLGGSVATFVATCAITSFAGNAAKGALSGIIGNASSWLQTNITSKVSSAITGAIGGSLGLTQAEVPTNDKKVRASTELTLQNVGQINRKETSVSAPTGSGGIVSGIAKDMFPAPSLDALAFCIGNEMIHYITQSTIQWINSGFEGKPVFIENAGNFFEKAADQEAGQFIQDLFGGPGGVDVCQPFRVQLAVDSIRSHTSTYQQRGRCTLSAIKNNYNGFMNNWNQGGLPGWFEIIQDQNNIYGARYQAQNALRSKVAQRQNTLKMELNWADGYRNFKHCTVPKRADGSCPPGKEITTTPGKIIESSINDRLGSSQKRLEVADEFDELVSALVNALVKTAINEVLTIGKDSGSSGGSNTGSNQNRDTTPPTVSITSPTNTTTVGTITISATASDNVGVTGVQFKIDGNNLQTEDRTAPYTISWNSTSSTNGTHVITAVAKDAQGNTKVSEPVIVIISN